MIAVQFSNLIIVQFLGFDAFAIELCFLVGFGWRCGLGFAAVAVTNV
jgi:hypothetical protein